MALPRLRKRSPEDAAVAAVLAGAASAAAAEVEAALTVPPDLTGAAFFDVDNTLVQGASIYFFGKGMAARGFITSRDLLRFGVAQVMFRLRGEQTDAISEARETALGLVAGRHVDEIVRYGEEVYDDLIAERIYSGTLALARQHLEAGQRVWLVTATPVELAQIISHRLGFTGALGTVSEVAADGTYTGRLVGEPLHGPAKAEAVRALAAREGLDLSRCTAYSDSSNDVPMLSVVGHPVAVNPDGALKDHARENGWEVRDFRTGRKAARVGIPAAAGAGALVGGVLAGLAIRRRLVRT